MAETIFFLSVVGRFLLRWVPIVKSIVQGLTGMQKVPQDPIWTEFCCEFDFWRYIFVYPLEKEL